MSWLEYLLNSCIPIHGPFLALNVYWTIILSIRVLALTWTSIERLYSHWWPFPCLVNLMNGYSLNKAPFLALDVCWMVLHITSLLPLPCRESSLDVCSLQSLLSNLLNCFNLSEGPCFFPWTSIERLFSQWISLPRTSVATYMFNTDVKIMEKWSIPYSALENTWLLLPWFIIT